MTVSKEDTHTNGSAANDRAKSAFVDSTNAAVSPNTPEKVPALLEGISSLGKRFTSEDIKARAELLDAARSLVYALETPREAMIRFCWSQPTSYAAVETCVDLNIFAHLSKDDKPKTAADLAESAGADATLVARLLKHICAVGVITETGPDTYIRTGFSTSLSMDRYSDAFPCLTACINNGIFALPAHLKKTGYKNPSDGNNCAFQLGYGTDQHFFEFLKHNPLAGKQFNNHMSAYHQGRPSWMDVGFYDVPGLSQAVENESDVLLVDMGGSLGHDVSEFCRKWPDAKGRLVLQDLPEVASQARQQSLHKSIDVMDHDFFTEQPVKGARAYYMHSILHDWADENGLRILKNIVPAMKRGYSKVLINENVIPDTNAYWETTSLDIIMMADFASTERTAAHWHKLVELAGLKITKIWTAQRGVESLMECELA